MMTPDHWREVGDALAVSLLDVAGLKCKAADVRSSRLRSISGLERYVLFDCIGRRKKEARAERRQEKRRERRAAARAARGLPPAGPRALAEDDDGDSDMDGADDAVEEAKQELLGVEDDEA